MKAVLIEHQSHVSIERTHWGRNTMFFVRMFSRVIGSQVEPVLRRAVAEILEGKTQEEARHIAVTMMKEVKSFSRMIYNDAPQTVRYLGFDVGVIKVDKEWLRSVAIQPYQKKNTTDYYFSNFVFLLMQIGRIWAAQLLANHGIDMHDLEKETGCILKPAEIGDYDYYVDKLNGDSSLSQRYVVDEEHARQLLSKIKQVDSMEEENQKDNNPQEEFLLGVAQQHNVNSNVFNNCQVTINNPPSSPESQEQKPMTGTQCNYGSKKDSKGGNKGKSGKNSKPAGLPKTLIYYTSDIEDDEKKARKERVEAVFQLWTKWEWIDIKTKADDFYSFFKGHDRHCNIKWTTNAAILTFLLKELISQTDVITKQTGCHPNSLVTQQFGFKKADYREVDKENKKRIDFTIFVLDVKNSFQEIYEEANNKMSEVDIDLMKKYADDELKKAMEEEVKKGNARIHKGTWG